MNLYMLISRRLHSLHAFVMDVHIFKVLFGWRVTLHNLKERCVLVCILVCEPHLYLGDEYFAPPTPYFPSVPIVPDTFPHCSSVPGSELRMEKRTYCGEVKRGSRRGSAPLLCTRLMVKVRPLLTLYVNRMGK